ncbi:hypothetical protein B0I08_109132 [Glaciihabitans tibetensis]|uniref:LPXTG-motif cell wall-anchored protein n=1 Tax=Glaciihabitans tibetensis TaxID=1266600 RepID=A0A2T0V715_9MICO|nr:hypothetical protein [Glaciihabitans tibetensis]PRY65982.1 hypothetical protein B0I08_109132 [Glaciihabitans tibetensis]
MYRRAVVLTVIAVLGGIGGAGLSTSALASEPATAHVVHEESTTEPIAIAKGSGTEAPREQVAETAKTPGEPVILVSGLAVLLAAILMVVRSGSSRPASDDQR